VCARARASGKREKKREKRQKTVRPRNKESKKARKKNFIYLKLHNNKGSII